MRDIQQAPTSFSLTSAGYAADGDDDGLHDRNWVDCYPTPVLAPGQEHGDAPTAGLTSEAAQVSWVLSRREANPKAATVFDFDIASLAVRLVPLAPPAAVHKLLLREGAFRGCKLVAPTVAGDFDPEAVRLQAQLERQRAKEEKRKQRKRKKMKPAKKERLPRHRPTKRTLSTLRSRSFHVRVEGATSVEVALGWRTSEEEAAAEKGHTESVSDAEEADEEEAGSVGASDSKEGSTVLQDSKEALDEVDDPSSCSGGSVSSLSDSELAQADDDDHFMDDSMPEPPDDVPLLTVGELVQSAMVELAASAIAATALGLATAAARAQPLRHGSAAHAALEVLQHGNISTTAVADTTLAMLERWYDGATAAAFHATALRIAPYTLARLKASAVAIFSESRLPPRVTAAFLTRACYVDLKLTAQEFAASSLLVLEHCMEGFLLSRDAAHDDSAAPFLDMVMDAVAVVRGKIESARLYHLADVLQPRIAPPHPRAATTTGSSAKRVTRVHWAIGEASHAVVRNSGRLVVYPTKSNGAIALAATTPPFDNTSRGVYDWQIRVPGHVGAGDATVVAGVACGMSGLTQPQLRPRNNSVALFASAYVERGRWLVGCRSSLLPGAHRVCE